MSKTKVLNKLNDVLNDDEYKKYFNNNAILQSEIKNNITEEMFKDLKKNKYSEYNTDNITYDKFKNNLSKTTAKRLLCASLLINQTPLHINLPYSETMNKNEYLSYNLGLNPDIPKSIKTGDVIKELNIESLKRDCREFYMGYCENVKSKLKKDYGQSYKEDLLADYQGGECACYADSYKYKYNKNKSFYDKLLGNETAAASMVNSPLSCQLLGCTSELKQYSPVPLSSQSCNNVTICTNQINIDGNTTIDSSELDFLTNMTNNCGSSEISNENKKKLESLKQKQEEPDKPETKPEDPEPKIKPQPDEPYEEPKPEPVKPITPIDPSPEPSPEPEPKSSTKKKNKLKYYVITGIIITIIVLFFLLLLFKL